MKALKEPVEPLFTSYGYKYGSFSTLLHSGKSLRKCDDGNEAKNTLGLQANNPFIHCILWCIQFNTFSY